MQRDVSVGAAGPVWGSPGCSRERGRQVKGASLEERRGSASPHRLSPLAWWARRECKGDGRAGGERPGPPPPKGQVTASVTMAAGLLGVGCEEGQGQGAPRGGLGRAQQRLTPPAPNPGRAACYRAGDSVVLALPGHGDDPVTSGAGRAGLAGVGVPARGAETLALPELTL